MQTVDVQLSQNVQKIHKIPLVCIYRDYTYTYAKTHTHTHTVSALIMGRYKESKVKVGYLG